MNAIKQALRDLEKKYRRRIKRGKEILNLADSVGTDQAERMIDDKLNELRGWTSAELVSEFVDREEALIRAAAEKITE